MHCVVNFANNRGNYLKGQKRLFSSLIANGFDGDFISFQDESQLPGCPQHIDNPYAFKIYAIEEALKKGYKKILFLDASVWAVKSVKPIFDVIGAEGYIMQNAGHMVGSWCNYATLRYFGVSREDAMKMPMYGNAGFLGLNAEDPIAMEFFKLWKESMLAGCFKGSWDDHRHDMTCGSIIANKLDMKYKKGSEYLAYVGGDYAKPADDIILYAQGM